MIKKARLAIKIIIVSAIALVNIGIIIVIYSLYCMINMTNSDSEEFILDTYEHAITQRYKTDYSLSDESFEAFKEGTLTKSYNVKNIKPLPTDINLINQQVELMVMMASPEDMFTATSRFVDTKLEQQQADTINDKKDAFVDQKVLREGDINLINPSYCSKNKMIVSSKEEAMLLDIRHRSNWTAQDFYKIVNEEMYGLVDVAISLEEAVGVNAIYTVAVGAAETGWGKHMAGRYNYFNWTNDAINHFNFETLSEFEQFSISAYSKNYIHESFYASKLGFTPMGITPEVVNVRYAINTNGTVNWNWSNKVCEIMNRLSDDRLEEIGEHGMGG